MTAADNFLMGLLAAGVLIGGIVNWKQRNQIHRLQDRVACLEHPAGASSIAGRFVGTGSQRRFVVTQPAHRTGCP